MADAENLALKSMIKEDEYRSQINQLLAQKDQLEKEAASARAKLAAFEDGETNRLLEFWAVHFPKMTFERQPARWVVHKHHRERLSLEKKLIELHNSEDPVALSLGKFKTTGEHHQKFRIGQVECRMFYRVERSQIKITKLGTNQETH